LPSTVLTLVFGEMARGTLLASQRVAPRRLDELGFQWRSPVLVEALRSVLLDA
jgi:NAD dependent epimerase/dehydratase family enzyme